MGWGQSDPLLSPAWRWGAGREKYNFSSVLGFVLVVAHVCAQGSRGPSARAQEQNCCHHCHHHHPNSRSHCHGGAASQGNHQHSGCFAFLWAGLARRTKAGIFLNARFIKKRHNLIIGDKKFQQDLAPR